MIDEVRGLFLTWMICAHSMALIALPAGHPFQYLRPRGWSTIGFVMLTVLLSQVGLGELAWVRILGGNVVGAVLTFVMLSRRHPLRQELKQAAADEE